VRILVALMVLAIAIWATVDPPAAWEIEVFRFINDLPRQAEWILWPVQQAGMALAVPVAALVLWFIVRNWRLSSAGRRSASSSGLRYVTSGLRHDKARPLRLHRAFRGLRLVLVGVSDEP
jgi:hypothetical protein